MHKRVSLFDDDNDDDDDDATTTTLGLSSLSSGMRAAVTMGCRYKQVKSDCAIGCPFRHANSHCSMRSIVAKTSLAEENDRGIIPVAMFDEMIMSGMNYVPFASRSGTV